LPGPHVLVVGRDPSTTRDAELLRASTRDATDVTPSTIPPAFTGTGEILRSRQRLLERVRVVLPGVRLADVALADVGAHGIRVALRRSAEASAAPGVQVDRRALRDREPGDLGDLPAPAVGVAHGHAVRPREAAAGQAPRGVARPLHGGRHPRVLEEV